jgi:hypothetical protein
MTVKTSEDMCLVNDVDSHIIILNNKVYISA